MCLTFLFPRVRYESVHDFLDAASTNTMRLCSVSIVFTNEIDHTEQAVCADCIPIYGMNSGADTMLIKNIIIIILNTAYV